MVGIKPQIALINTSIAAVMGGAVFGTKQLYDAPVYDIFENGEEEKVGGVYPGYVDQFGDNKSCAVDNQYCVQIYHRILSSTINDASGYGKVNDLVSETLQCKMVVYGQPNIILLNQEELYRLIIGGMPSQIDKTSISAYLLDYMRVKLQGATFNSTALFNEEYKGISQRFGLPNGIYFSIAYQIESKFKKDCFVDC